VTIKTVLWEAIPEVLRAAAQWLVWRWEEKGGKWTKVPLDVREPSRRGSSTDPSTWGGFTRAKEIVEAGRASVGSGRPRGTRPAR